MSRSPEPGSQGDQSSVFYRPTPDSVEATSAAGRIFRAHRLGTLGTVPGGGFGFLRDGWVGGPGVLEWGLCSPPFQTALLLGFVVWRGWGVGFRFLPVGPR
jgi:hypothetical protein